MINDDWHRSQLALQILAEEGPGRIVAEIERQETAAVRGLSRALRR